MGRRLLLIALAAGTALVAGCGGGPEPMHADVPCARCHDGAPTQRADSATGRLVAAATSDACIDCHEGAGGGRVAMGVVEFDHRDHAGDDAVDIGCAACHTHRSGGDSLTVTTSGCVLCHASELDGSTPTECRSCHVDPEHTALTSQAVPVAHRALPWIGGECIRCHYDVGQPVIAVETSRCVDCHEDAARIAEQGAGRDLHPAHTGVTCASCHEATEHHIGAMSSSVDLSCAQCHSPVHDVAADEPLLRESASCNGCHASVHAEQQGMVLGAAPAALPATPADKFLVGLTCRSCHVPGTGATASATQVSCTTCHPSQYARVLDWWTQGTDERIADARRYVAAAAARAGSDAARTHVAAADSLVRFVESGGGAHNLPLSHDALATAVSRAADSYAGAAPPLPDLGRRPRMGQCTYCHYLWREPRFTTEMPDAFHREAMERGRLGAQVTGAEP